MTLNLRTALNLSNLNRPTDISFILKCVCLCDEIMLASHHHSTHTLRSNVQMELIPVY